MTGDELRRVLRLADKVVPKKTTLPILRTVRFSRAVEYIEIQATDLDLSFRVWIEGAGPENCCIDLRKLMGAVELEGAGEVRQWKERGVQVGGIKLEGMDPEDYPVLPGWPTAEEKRAATCCADDLQVACEVATATSGDEARVPLHYVLLERTVADGLTVAGTDGHRMYTAGLQDGIAVNLKKSCLLHPWALNLAVLCCAAFGTEGVNIWVRKGKKGGSLGDARDEVVLGGSMWSVCCKVDSDLIFPDYRRVIKRKGVSVRLDAEPFYTAFRKAQTACTKLGVSADHVAWYPQKGVIHKMIPDVGEFQFEIPAAEPEVTATGFNAFYIAEALKFLAPAGEGIILFKQKDGQSAGIFKCGSRLALVMPVRLEEKDLAWAAAQGEPREEAAVATG